MLKFTVDKELQNLTVGRFLRTYCSVSARTLAKLKRIEGGIKLNGNFARAIDFVKIGDVIEINLPQSVSKGVLSVDLPLDILFEDDYIIVLNKPPFMPVHPTKVHQEDTLANALCFYAQNRGETYTFRAVNRLDRNTSGIVIVAKDRHTASMLSNGNIKKHYIAFVHGKIDVKGTINEPIALSDNSKIVRCVTPFGKEAITHYEPLKILNDFTIIKLVLETGRTHQIRCHMSYIGHPLLGDDLYGGEVNKINRHALHCEYVSFLHPITKKFIEITAEMPVDMKKCV